MQLWSILGTTVQTPPCMIMLNASLPHTYVLTWNKKAIIQEGIKHRKPSREIRRPANKTNPDNIIGPKVVHNAKYNMHNASNPDTPNRVMLLMAYLLSLIDLMTVHSLRK